MHSPYTLHVPRPPHSAYQNLPRGHLNHIQKCFGTYPIHHPKRNVDRVSRFSLVTNARPTTELDQ